MQHTETVIFFTNDSGVLEASVYARFTQRGVFIQEGRRFHLVVEATAPPLWKYYNALMAMALFRKALADQVAMMDNDALAIADLLEADVPVRIQLDIGYTAQEAREMALEDSRFLPKSIRAKINTGG